MNWVYVFIGGGMGSMLRYAFQTIAQRLNWSNLSIPTISANILGCFLIGLLASLVATNQQGTNTTKYLWIIGFCGGFTTFSSFSNETIQYIKQDNWFAAIVYILLTNLICLLATYSGYKAEAFFFNK